ncbi:hypothetical protein ACFVWF_32650 [Rhodococcus qingshengii]|uniref:hypothetical protein n=1 Tax=Rhodococcus qingshengii TaxID=334542 RepID=UPI0036D89B21
MSFPGADREIVAFPPAPMLVIPIDAAVSGIGTVAATLVTTPVYPMDVTGVGTAKAAVTTSSVIPAAVAGEGEALAVFAQLIEAPVSGVGTASVGMKPSITLAAGVTGSGIASATVTPVATIAAAATCEGIPGVDAWPAALVTIAASGSGTPSAAVTARTPINASASGEGTPVAAVTAVTFTASGAMLTAENQTGSTTPAKTTGWVADTATYPGSAIVSNGVQMRGSKTGAKFKFAGPVYWTWSGNVNIAAYVGGVQRGTTAVINIPNAYTEYQRSGEITIDVANGEVVDLYMWAGQSFGVTRRVGFKYWVE